MISIVLLAGEENETTTLLGWQVTFMAHSCVDAVKQSAHRRQPDQAS